MTWTCSQPEVPRGASPGERDSVPARLAAPDRLLAAVVLSTSVILPLLFFPVVEDAFALPKVTLLRITFGLSVPLVCIALMTRPRRPSLPPLVSVLALAYLSLNALALAFSEDPRRSFLGEYLQYQGFTTILIYAGTFYLGARIFGSLGTAHLLFWAVGLGGLAVSAYGLAQMLDLDPLDWSFGSGPPARAFSSIGQSGALATYLVLVIPLAVALLAGTGRPGRLLLIAVITISSIVLTLTFSRGAYLGFLIAVPVALLPR